MKTATTPPKQPKTQEEREFNNNRNLANGRLTSIIIGLKRLKAAIIDNNVLNENIFEPEDIILFNTLSNEMEKIRVVLKDIRKTMRNEK